MKNKIVDILTLIGFILISIGFFIWNTIIGFLGTGLGLIGIAYLIYSGGEND